MKQDQITGANVRELRDTLRQERLNLTKLRLQHSVSPLENPARIQEGRKTIARLKTELHKRDQLAKTTSAA